jgi:hypothetical protein
MRLMLSFLLLGLTLPAGLARADAACAAVKCELRLAVETDHVGYAVDVAPEPARLAAYQAFAASAAVERPTRHEAALLAENAARARCERSLRRGRLFGPGAAESRLAALTCVGVPEPLVNAARARCERSLRRGPHFGPGAAEARLAALTCVGVPERPVLVPDVPG